jgi:D-alanyl-lipoteichoic acid acyltransferase DltB (MBOAT superfamily)
MLFNSVQFIFAFLPIVITVYYLLHTRSQQLSIWWLVAASLFFYSAWDISFLPIFLLSVISNFCFSLGIERCPQRARRAVLALGIIFNLGLLAYFKYANFIVSQVSWFSGTHIDWVAVVLPIGISFFTFQQIAYLVDVSRSQAKERSFVRYLLFNSFFPHLIAGPITHHKEMMSQFGRSRPNPVDDMTIGLTFFTVGLAKKVLIADTVSPYSTAVFANAASGNMISSADAWTAILCYSLQIYFDFSAYSDMAIGLAKMFGIDFPINFASPYKSTSISDFWRRWHISLSRFLRDYLYIPLGGNRVSPRRRQFNLFATMVIGGVWHGAGWTFLVWGTLHGVYLLVNDAWRKTALAGVLADYPIWRYVAWLFTMLAVMFAWVPFRAESMGVTIQMWQAMGGFGPDAKSVVAHWQPLMYIIIFGACAVLLPNIYEILASTRTGLPSKGYPATAISRSPAPTWLFSKAHGVAFGVVFALVALKLSDVSEFIYFQF